MALVPRLETAVGRMVPECFNVASLRCLGPDCAFYYTPTTVQTADLDDGSG
jgi:hypothetical protein